MRGDGDVVGDVKTNNAQLRLQWPEREVVEQPKVQYYLVRDGQDDHPQVCNCLLHQLNLTWLPRLIEPRLQRPIESQDYVPAFPGDSLHPILLLAGLSFGSEVDVHGSV